MIRILNDLHIGFKREAGTTPTSQELLRSWLLNNIKEQVNKESQALLVAGDLFDKFTVDSRDLLDTFRLLGDFLNRGDARLILVAGNHDNSPKAEKVSSFTLLAEFLTANPNWSDRVTVLDVNGSTVVWSTRECIVWAIAHCENQAAFDEKLRNAFGVLSARPDGPRYLVVHANYDNGFAEEADHSLNLSEEQARCFTDSGITILVAHEHQYREALSGKVVVMGNQFPTSISDCLRNDDKKSFVIQGDGSLAHEVVWSSTQDAGGFAEIDWQDLEYPDQDFIRVVGHATAAQASDVVNTVAEFRKRHPGFIVTNSVKVDGIAAVESMPESFEAASAFDVMDFIRDQLEPAEMDKVLKLIES